MLHILFRNMPAKRIPHDGEHPERRREHAARHRADALGPPAEDLRERPERPAGEVEQVRRRVPRGVPRHGHVLHLALLREVVGDRPARLRLERRFDEGDGEAGFEVPFDVTCSRIVSAWMMTMVREGRRTVEDPDSGVVGDETEGDALAARHLDGVATDGVRLGLVDGRVQRGVVRRVVRRTLHDLELVAVQVAAIVNQQRRL